MEILDKPLMTLPVLQLRYGMGEETGRGGTCQVHPSEPPHPELVRILEEVRCCGGL